MHKILYKTVVENGKEVQKQVKVPAIDAPGWIQIGGWSESSDPAKFNPEAQPTQPKTVEPHQFDASRRLDDLMGIYKEEGGWREIKALVEQYGIQRPDGTWEEAIPLVVEHEQKQFQAQS